MAKTWVCDHCGSTDVTCDAVCRWNMATQEWDLSGIYDDLICGECGYDGMSFTLKEVPDDQADA